MAEAGNGLSLVSGAGQRMRSPGFRHVAQAGVAGFVCGHTYANPRLQVGAVPRAGPQ